MSDKFNYFGVFLVSIISIAVIAKMMNLAINATESRPEPEKIMVLNEYRFGNCEADTDCFLAGCSQEVCSSDSELVTTCEVKANIPDKEIYRCGCVQNNCVWKTR